MALEHTLESVLAEVVRAVGSQSAYARLVGRSQTWVWQALAEGKEIQAEHVLIVEHATGISRHDLRPDLYPRDPAPIAGEHPSRAAAPEPAR